MPNYRVMKHISFNKYVNVSTFYQDYRIVNCLHLQNKSEAPYIYFKLHFNKPETMPTKPWSNQNSSMSRFHQFRNAELKPSFCVSWIVTGKRKKIFLKHITILSVPLTGEDDHGGAQQQVDGCLPPGRHAGYGRWDEDLRRDVELQRKGDEDPETVE